MLKLLTLFFCCYGATVLQSRPLVQNAEEQVASCLPGVENLGEKSIPVATTLPGNINLAERMQIESVTLPDGRMNVAEKAIPNVVILRMADSHPKSEYEHI